jgi:hypothetical protein
MSSRRAPRALDDRELIAAILERIAGGRPFAPGQIGGALEADGLRLELAGTITRAPARDEIAKYRTEALAELEKEPRRATRCGVYTQRRGGAFTGRGGGPCESKKIVAALVLANGWRQDLRFVFVCGRHIEAHGFALADILAVVYLTPRELEEPRRLAAEEAAAAARRRREDEAENERLALTLLKCPRCGAEPGEPCCYVTQKGHAEVCASTHHDRLAGGERLRLKARAS